MIASARSCSGRPPEDRDDRDRRLLKKNAEPLSARGPIWSNRSNRPKAAPGSTICMIVPETCRAIWDTLQLRVMPTPDMRRLNSVAQDFARIWQFPNIVGAIDGKHVVMQAARSPNLNFLIAKRRTATSSWLWLMPTIIFSWFDVGGYGRSSDAGIFSRSTFGHRLMEGEPPLP